MRLHIRTAYLDEDAVLKKGRYADGSTALALFDAETGEMLSKATVCMVDYGETPRSEHYVFIKDYGENEGMVNALFAANVIGAPLRSLDAGHAKGGVHECLVVNLNAIPEIG